MFLHVDTEKIYIVAKVTRGPSTHKLQLNVDLKNKKTPMRFFLQHEVFFYFAVFRVCVFFVYTGVLLFRATGDFCTLSSGAKRIKSDLATRQLQLIPIKLDQNRT